MAVEIVVPPLGESVTEATIAKWHKQPGDAIEVDELLVELETDKVTLEVNAPSSGVLQEVLVNEGDNVGVGAILGQIDEKGKGAVKSASSQASVNSSASVASASSGAPACPITPPQSAGSAGAGAGIASPAAGKILAEKGIDAKGMAGSGKDGRITKADAMGASAGMQASGGIETIYTPKLQDDNSVREERVKMSRLRQTIARRLKDSQNTAAILSTFNEVDMSHIFRIRKMYQEQFVKKHGCKLGFMSFFTKAVVAALKEIPAVNCEIDGDTLVYKNYYDIGIAVGTDQGLVVPVLRDADKLSFAEIEQGIADLGKKAREGKLSMKDMTGGTFSITNGGTYGSLLSTPIINPPQSGILGMHNIVERPMAVKGQVEIRPMMYIALSYDHRIIDGKEAVTFLVIIKNLLENPEKMLFDL